MFISASKDTTAKLFDTDTLECLKTYKTDRPVNSASISPVYEHVVLGGGKLPTYIFLMAENIVYIHIQCI